MIPLQVTPDIERAPWSNCRGLQLGTVKAIGRLPRGMESGESSVTLLVELPDGSKCVAQTSYKLLRSAMRVLEVVEDAAAAKGN